jgi:RND family efflux transporter MFP subunit
MQLLRKRWWLVAFLLVVVVAGAAAVMTKDGAATDSGTVAKVRRGPFSVTVATSGELRALKFVEITVPEGAQQAGAYEMKIASIVPEGTVVKVGDLVAELDRATLANSMTEVNLALQKASAVNEQAMLDSALNLSKAREEMRSMELGLEEKTLAKQQAAFEAPTVRRQAEIDLEKAQRALAQAKLDYKTRTEQAQAKMREVGADLDRQRNRAKAIQDFMTKFTITAPAPGMVIYTKEWNGKKRTTGSRVSAWDPTVATLPDLTQMESITYVNEIDVRKVAVGQPVTLTLDSDPTKQLTGTVTTVANVGEQRPNTDAKVFEVRVTVTQSDTTLRPGMTTGNAIETYRADSVLVVPLEAINSESGVPFVYRRRGGTVTKQEIVTGAMNDDEVVIAKGLDADDEVLLIAPANAATLTVTRVPGSPVRNSPSKGDTAVPGAAPVGAPKGTSTDPKAGGPVPGATKSAPATVPPATAAPKG